MNGADAVRGNTLHYQLVKADWTFHQQVYNKNNNPRPLPGACTPIINLTTTNWTPSRNMLAWEMNNLLPDYPVLALRNGVVRARYPSGAGRWGLTRVIEHAELHNHTTLMVSEIQVYKARYNIGDGPRPTATQGHPDVLALD